VNKLVGEEFFYHAQKLVALFYSAFTASTLPSRVEPASERAIAAIMTIDGSVRIKIFRQRQAVFEILSSN